MVSSPLATSASPINSGTLSLTLPMLKQAPHAYYSSLIVKLSSVGSGIAGSLWSWFGFRADVHVVACDCWVLRRPDSPPEPGRQDWVHRRCRWLQGVLSKLSVPRPPTAGRRSFANLGVGSKILAVISVAVLVKDRTNRSAEAVRVGQPQVVREDDGLDPVACSDFGEYPADVGLDRGFRQDQPLGDLAVGPAAADGN